MAEKILTSKAALEGERKQVTVLFADLKGSMELLADRDPEEARQLLDPVLERMMEAVHRYEGTVNQVMGDGIMALFGAPIAHEDHAVRACYAALAMQAVGEAYAEEVPAHAWHHRAHPGRAELAARWWCARSAAICTWTTRRWARPRIWRRAWNSSPPRAVLLTADALRLAEGYVQVKALGPVPVKGLQEPIEVFELAGAGPARTRLQALAARGLTPFVGRRTERQALRDTLARAGTGRGQLVAVLGEPGVGKSRLLAEFLASPFTQGWLILEAHAVSYGQGHPLSAHP